jgi:hypothetical protein
MALYRGSKMCSGRKTFGKRTTLGSGKRGRRSKVSNRPEKLENPWNLGEP